MILILSFSSAYAEQEKPAQKSNDKMNIKKLEEKYWAAKDDDFSVVQNRRYTKAERYFISASGGAPINDPAGTGLIATAQGGYFFNERWGVDISYTKADMKNNDNTRQFIETFGVAPNYNFFSTSQMLSVSYVPLYAKMSFVDKTIIYFDLGVTLGVGNAVYKIKREDGDLNKSAFCYQIGFNPQIFFADNFAVRLDFINKFITEERSKYGANEANRNIGPKLFNDTHLLVGMTYWY